MADEEIGGFDSDEGGSSFFRPILMIIHSIARPTFITEKTWQIVSSFTSTNANFLNRT